MSATSDQLAACLARIDGLETEFANAEQAVQDATAKRDEVSAKLASEQELRRTLEGALP